MPLYSTLPFLDNLEVLNKFLCTVKISFPVILQMWENKSGAGADPCPVWTGWYLIYMMPSATLLLNVRIILLDHFSDRFPSYVVCVCNHYCRTNQNCRSMMGLTNHISCVYDAFSSYTISFSLVMSLTTMGLSSGHLVRALFNFSLESMLVVSVT